MQQTTLLPLHPYNVNTTKMGLIDENSNNEKVRRWPQQVDCRFNFLTVANRMKQGTWHYIFSYVP